MLISNFSWNGQAVWMYKAILYIAATYILLCKIIMLTITKHVFINLFQTEHFSAVKFAMGYKKNTSFLVIAKSHKAWKKKKSWKDRTGIL